VSSRSGPGPWRVENGVPVGYAHTPDGAVAAATNFLTVQDGSLLLHPSEYRAAIDTLAAPETKAALRSQAENTLASFQGGSGLITSAQQGKAVVYRTTPLAYRLDSYDGRSAAQVSIWAETFIAVDGVLPPAEVWATDAYTVVWTSGDWKLVTTGGSAGPMPTVSQTPVQTPQLPPQLKEFKSYHYDLGT
jgi:hypothetical protein